MHHLSFLQAVVLGVLQGVTELFPISSLGHSVLLPAWLGGSWARLARDESGESPFLAFLVGMHVATALALLAYFREEWARIVRAFVATLGKRRADTPDERLAWLVVLATVPVGILGLAFEHALRTLFAKPLAASIFLTLNAFVLLAGERYRRRDEVRQLAAVGADAGEGERADALRAGEPPREADSPREQGRPAASLRWKEAIGVGLAQSTALLAGISRSGATMVAGLARGLSHEDAARFAFLLATPVILLAGLYKLPDLFGPLGNGVRPQILVGSLVSGVAAYLSVRFLDRYFQSRTLTPFAVYCLIAGAASIVRFTAF